MNAMLETFSLKGMVYALTFILNVWMSEADEAGQMEQSDILDYLNNLNRLEQIDLEECYHKFDALRSKIHHPTDGRWACDLTLNEPPGALHLFYMNLDTVGTEEGESLTVEIEMDDKVPRTQMDWQNGTEVDCPKLGLPAAAEEYAKTDGKATVM